MNLFDLFATINLDSSEYERGLDNAEKSAHGFGDKLKGALGGMAKATAVGMTAAAAGATAITKAAVDGFADFEQLSGGIETLFGDSMQTVMKDADNAFKTAGISANEYMETAIGSAASLINSLGGDQAAAAELMNMSITDMADNVNKMGTSMEAVQNAYRGFSRGNFTMLDNLALGFAGTKEGMQELLDKAKEISGVEFNIDSYADIVKAINVVQTEMGITGTTAKEATETIAGSTASVKSAWQNLVTSLAVENADIGANIDNFIVSLENMFNNIIPVAERALNGLVQAAIKIAPSLADLFGNMLGSIVPALIDVLPELAETGLSLIETIVNVILDNMPKLIKAGLNIIQSIAKSISKNIPALTKAMTTAISEIAKILTEPKTLSMLLISFLDIMLAIAESISSNLPTLIDAFMLVIDNIVKFVTGNLPKFVDAAVKIMLALLDGLMEALPQLLEYLPQIINGIVEGLLAMLPILVEAGVTLLVALVNDLPAIIEAIVVVLPDIINAIVTTLIDNIDLIIGAGFTLLTALVDNMPQIVTEIVLALPQILTGITQSLASMIPQIVEAGFNLLTSLITDLPKVLLVLFTSMPQVIVSIVDGLLSGIGSIIDVGVKIVEGLWEGIKSMGSWLFDKVGGFFGDVVDTVTGIFDIFSPSRVFKNIGKMIDMGFVEGIEDYADLAVKAAEGMSDDVIDAVNTDLDFTANAASDTMGAGNRGGVVINVYGEEGQDVNELAEIISQKMAFAYSQEQAVWA